MAKQLARRSDALARSPCARLAPSLEPGVRLAEENIDRDDEQRGQHADEEQHAPAGAARRRSSLRAESTRLVSDPRMLPRADNACSAPRAIARNRRRHALGDERRRRAEHPADAESGEEPVDREVHPALRQAAEGR